MNNKPLRIIVGVGRLLLVECASTPGAGTEAVTTMPTAGQVRPTITAATSTRTPQLTTVATATPTPYPDANLPDVPLSRDGPWLIFEAATEQTGPDYLWAINDNGTGLTQLVDEPVLQAIYQALSGAPCCPPFLTDLIAE
ncbi:MAG: hypothetical protein JXB07_08305 [Anaerolineae bacterium]|nr:hypothetical protein [Anaerolineae bacterium]